MIMPGWRLAPYDHAWLEVSSVGSDTHYKVADQF